MISFLKKWSRDSHALSWIQDFDLIKIWKNQVLKNLQNAAYANVLSLQFFN